MKKPALGGLGDYLGGVMGEAETQFAMRECEGCHRNVFYEAGDMPVTCPHCTSRLEPLPLLSASPDRSQTPAERKHIRRSPIAGKVTE